MTIPHPHQPAWNAIWDFDGTLYDTYPSFAAAYAAMLEENGFSAPHERLIQLAIVSLEHCSQTLSEEFDLPLDHVNEAFKRHYLEIPLETQPPFTGVRQVCEWIGEHGGRNYIATHRRPAGLARLLDAHDMRHYFGECLTVYDGYNPKPDPAMFEALIARHGLERPRTLAIGDRDIDVQAGKAAGLPTVLYGSFPCTADPDCRIRDYRELLDWMQAGVWVSGTGPAS
jgi:phosphoglycolate phosphatase-like HAD superfamily hydrolase